MGFFRRLFGGGQAKTGDRFFHFYVFSRRCNEALAGRMDTMNELSVAEESDAAWFCRKVVHTTGHNRCFDSIEVECWFDASKRLLRQEVHGGQWLEADEYERLLLAHASTLEDDRPGEGTASDADEREKPGGNPNPT